MARPLQPQRITAEVDAMDDKFVEATLAKLKALYDSGAISESFYYRTQCKIFKTIRNEHPARQVQMRHDEQGRYSADPAKKVRISRIVSPRHRDGKGRV